MMSELRFGLKEEVQRQICAIFSRYIQVKEVRLYGSRAKGNFRPGSDIDLTIEGENLDLKILNRISNDLDDLLLPYTFDLSLYAQIDNSDLREHIRRVGVVFYAQSGDR